MHLLIDCIPTVIQLHRSGNNYEKEGVLCFVYISWNSITSLFQIKRRRSGLSSWRKETPPPFSVTHPVFAVSYHVTAQCLHAISSTQKRVVGLLHLMDHSNVIVATLNDMHFRSQQSVTITCNLHKYLKNNNDISRFYCPRIRSTPPSFPLESE